MNRLEDRFRSMVGVIPCDRPDHSISSKTRNLPEYLPGRPRSIEPYMHQRIVRTAREHIETVAPPGDRGGTGGKRATQ
jgi:hypothetical protein